MCIRFISGIPKKSLHKSCITDNITKKFFPLKKKKSFKSILLEQLVHCKDSSYSTEDEFSELLLCNYHQYHDSFQKLSSH